MLLIFYLFLFFETVILVSSQRTMKRYNVLPPLMSTRRTTHVYRVVSKTCLLEPDPGPCRGNIRMYFYDVGAKACNVFLWGGCQGNGNRFDSEETCKTTCLAQPGWLDRPRRPRFCQLSFDYGWCFGAENRYYYDRLWKTCKKSIYSGCGGNKNNFYNIEQCDQVCKFGNAPLKASRFGSEKLVKKVLIVNPYGITDPPASRGQRSTTAGGDVAPTTSGNRATRIDNGNNGNDVQDTTNAPAPTPENTANRNGEEAEKKDNEDKPAAREGKSKHKKHHHHHHKSHKDYK